MVKIRYVFVLWLVILFYALCQVDYQLLADRANFENAARIYARIVAANDIVDAPQFHQYDVGMINAMTDEQQDGAIFITTGMLRFAHNDDEIALILGHELGHWVHRGREVPYYMEYESDAFGAKAMSRAGYDACKGAMVMWRFDSPDSSTHPDSNSRWMKITGSCYKGENNGD